jgi:hypothetical protein
MFTSEFDTTSSPRAPTVDFYVQVNVGQLGKRGTIRQVAVLVTSSHHVPLVLMTSAA